MWGLAVGLHVPDVRYLKVPRVPACALNPSTTSVFHMPSTHQPTNGVYTDRAQPPALGPFRHNGLSVNVPHPHPWNTPGSVVGLTMQANAQRYMVQAGHMAQLCSCPR